MIERLKKLYPNHLIIIKKKRLYVDDKDKVVDIKQINKSYILITSNYSYEVHNKSTR